MKTNRTNKPVYDKNDRIAKVILPREVAEQGEHAKGYRYQYDTQDRIISLTGCDGTLLYERTYNPYGELEQETDNMGSGIKFVYDYIGRRIQANTTGVNAKLSENDFDASVCGVVISGSRCRGLEGKFSDLDVVVELSGNEREDDLFNLLHEDNFKIGGVPVDINPITKYKTGTLEEYLPDVEKYLEEKSRKTSIKDKLVEKKKAADARTVAVEKTAKKKSEEIR